MDESTEIRNRLREVEFVRVRYLLEMVDEFHWTLERGLELRTKLVRAACRAGEDSGGIDRFESMLDPPASADPVARRRHQKPAPGFVIHLPTAWPLELREGERLPLDVVFWGQANRFLADFSLVLEYLGRSGLDRRSGRFKVRGGLAVDATGRFSPLEPDSPFSSWAPPLIPARWWLESQHVQPAKISLTFRTPLRLMSGGRPLFQCDFARLFPFLLRRVTSMCHTYCHVDLFDDPGPLIASAERCRTVENVLEWRDARVVTAGEGKQGVGGLMGRLEVDLQGNPDLLDLLRIGSLLNVGKSSAFGSGGFQVDPE